MVERSTPNVSQFKPLPKQLEIIKDVRRRFDYSKGTHELLLSGSVGSAKSLTMAHLIVTHCLLYPRARVGIGRLALPQLKATLCQKIKEHLYESGIPYKYSETTGNFQIAASEVKAVSWADGNLTKLGSLEFSAFAIEELTETDYEKPYDIILQRTNRLPHIKEPWVISGTNPDSPSHWAYKKLVESKSDKVKVYYSNTYDNPYLPISYIDTLKERLDPKMAERMIYGRWVEINSEVVYYAYDKSKNFRDSDYIINPNYPIILTWDFNIGEGKPLSLVLMQYIRETDEFHIFDEVIVDGQRTLDSLEELEARGFLRSGLRYKVRGDRSGKSRDTRSIKTDYDIISDYLANYTTKNGQRLIYTLEVPRSNPPVRTRHNIVNGYIENSKGMSKVFVYRNAKTVDEGFRLTKLKPGGSLITEDDSDRFQHCTTAVGYAIMYEYYQNQLGQGPSSRSGGY